MIARLPGSEPGRVKLTAQVPVSGVEREREREVSGIPQLSVPALVQILVVFAQLVLGVLLPTPILVRW